MLVEREVTGYARGALQTLDVTFKQPGDHRLTFLQPGAGPKGGRAGRTAYVIPLADGAP